MNQPWIRWYPGDWRRDPGLACVSLAARGLWMELLMAMHDCEPVGTLAINGRAPTPSQIAALVRSTVADVEAGLAELEDAGVFSRDAEGRICSRRMARDAEDAVRISANLSRAGAVGASKRWGGHADANGQAMARPSEKHGQAIATARARADSDSDSVSDSLSGEGVQGESRSVAGKPQTWETVLALPEFDALRSDPAWMAAWSDWIEHARTPGTKARVPKPKGARAAFRYALEVGPAAHAEAIQASIRNDWQGINVEWVRRGSGPSGRVQSHADRAIADFKAMGGKFEGEMFGGEPKAIRSGS